MGAHVSTQPRDVSILRGLAARVAEIAQSPEQARRRLLWRSLNGLRPERPVVFCSPEGAWQELIPEEALECSDEDLRAWERELRMRLYAWEHFRHDEVVDTRFAVSHVVRGNGWGLEPCRVYSDDSRGAYYWYGPLRQESDLDRLSSPHTEVDQALTDRRLALAQSLFDGILDVQLRTSHWWSFGLIGELAQLRGLEQVMLDMCERPAWVHQAMRTLMEGRLAWLSDLETRGLLALNNGNDYVGSGAFGWTDELPAADHVAGQVRTGDMWGFAEAQEISGVSPAMHDEFVLQYQAPILERFGLNCYGCCEPLHHKLGMVLRMPHLRRVSVSPWCDRAIAAEALADRYVYSWKPHPAYLAGISFDAEAVRADIRRTLTVARGCVVEMVLKDTHTCNHRPERFDLWTQIAMEEVERARP
jgi:hypothetical protein